MKHLILILIFFVPFLLGAQTFSPTETTLQPKDEQLLILVTDAVTGLPTDKNYWTGKTIEEVLGRALPKMDLDTTDNVTTWDDITNKPTFFAGTWTALTGKPTSFPSAWATTEGIPADLLDGDANTTYTAGTNISIDVAGVISSTAEGGFRLYEKIDISTTNTVVNSSLLIPVDKLDIKVLRNGIEITNYTRASGQSINFPIRFFPPEVVEIYTK